jgi:prepilin peptidase CpaA
MTHLAKDFDYLAAAAVCAVLGAIFDIRSRKIPNLLTGPALLLGLALHLALDGWRGLLSAFAAMLVCGIVFLIFHLAGGMGAGDVKLMAATGCLGGLPNCGNLLVVTALAGGAMAIGLALLRGRLKSTLFNVVALANHHTQAGLTPHPELNVLNAATLRLPYGIAIAAGCCVTFYLQMAAR